MPALPSALITSLSCTPLSLCPRPLAGYRRHSPVYPIHVPGEECGTRVAAANNWRTAISNANAEGSTAGATSGAIAPGTPRRRASDQTLPNRTHMRAPRLQPQLGDGDVSGRRERRDRRDQPQFAVSGGQPERSTGTRYRTRPRRLEAQQRARLVGSRPGSGPERRGYASLADFADADGSTWVLQEIAYRPPEGAIGRQPLD